MGTFRVHGEGRGWVTRKEAHGPKVGDRFWGFRTWSDVFEAEMTEAQIP